MKQVYRTPLYFVGMFVILMLFAIILRRTESLLTSAISALKYSLIASLVYFADALFGGEI